MKRKRVIIIGQGYSGRLSIVRSVAVLGCDITLIAIVPNADHPQKPLDAYSRYVSRCFFCRNHDEKALVDLLLNKCKGEREDEKAVIIPDNDFAASVVDRYLKEIEPFFHCPHIEHLPGEVSRWMDKVQQKRLAREVGLQVANSVMIDLAQIDTETLALISYPCFVKPLMSSDCGKVGIGRCDNQNELESHLDLMRKAGTSRALVEEYKDIEREYATLGFSDGNHVFIPGLLQLLRIAHGSHTGVAIQGKAFPITGNENLVEKFEAFIKRTGFVGIFDIDYYTSGGVYYFGELNLRFGGSGYVFTRMGANLPAIFVNYCYGDDYNMYMRMIETESIYVNERMALDDWSRGYLTMDEMTRISRCADVHFVKDPDDKVPYRMFYITLLKLRLNKSIHRWLRI